MKPVFACIILFNLALQSAQISALPQNDPVPGGVAVVSLQAGETATYNNRPVMVVEEHGHLYAIVGIPVSGKPGQHHIKPPSGSHAFTVQGKDYET